MARKHGALNYSKNQVSFIRRNWMLMSDETMSRETKIPLSSIQKIRNRFGLSRFSNKVQDNATKALICELYVSEMPIKEISGIVGKGQDRVAKIISKNLFGVPLSDDVIVVVKKSKI